MGKPVVAVGIVATALTLMWLSKTHRGDKLIFSPLSSKENSTWTGASTSATDTIDGDFLILQNGTPRPPAATIEGVNNATDLTNAGWDGEAQRKPLFVLHIGPPKTGTTTVQCYAGTHKEVLSLDNVHFLGTNKKKCGGYPDIRAKYLREKINCTHYCNCTDALWDALEKAAEYHHRVEENVLYSDELLYWTSKDCERVWSRLGKILDEKWRVRVVFTYRRYFDWLVSEFHQSYNAEKSSFQSWPNEGGKVVPSFSDFYEETKVDYLERGVRPQDVKKRYEERVSDVSIINMHQEGDFLSNFFCGAVPEAPHLCNRRRSEVGADVVENPSSAKSANDCFDQLAVTAYERGWVNGSGISRAAVREAVKARSKKWGLSRCERDFPLKCLSSEQNEALLEESIRLEATMVPEFFASPMGEEKVRAGFSDAMARKAFCWIDMEQVLQDERWYNFFSGMH